MTDSRGRTFSPCPRCGAADASRAIAAVVAAGTRRTEGTQWSAGAAWTDDGVIPVAMDGEISSVEQTDLARMLDLPKPEQPASFVTGCLAIIVVAAGLLLAGLAALVTFVGRTLTTVDPTLTTSDTTGAVILAVLAALFIVGPTVAIAWALVQLGRGLRNRWEVAHREWQVAVPIAARLVYCARDHIVYDPANAGRWMHPAQTRTYALERGATEQRR